MQKIDFLVPKIDIVHYAKAKGVIRKFSREGHKFQTKIFFHFFAQQANNGNIFCVFRTKLGAFRTNKMKKIFDFSRADYKKGKIS